MKILCITHADFETPGKIIDWAIERQHQLTISSPYNGDNLPPADSFDTLVIMGGPQSVNRLDLFPYLETEIDFIKTVVAIKKPILGFCLGAQLLGRAYGELAQKSPEKEIGVFPISLTQEGKEDPFLSLFPQDIPVIHWHGKLTPKVKNIRQLFLRRVFPC